MKILIATDMARQKEAGTAGVLLNYARELQRNGHAVESWFSEDILTGPTSKRFASLIFAVRIARRILRERTKYDVVILHLPVGFAYGLWHKVFRPAGAPPYVFVTQGILERYALAMRREDRKGRAWHFGWANRLWHRVYHRALYDCAMRTADYGVASNREAWTYPEIRFDVDPGRFWYVPNGTEECFFIDREYKNAAPLRLLFVGTWLDRKGVYYLVEAFRQVLQRHPHVELTVAGCLCAKETVINSFPSDIRGKIKVLPHIQRDDMLALYADHDIFLLPSLMEGMPLALMEAMATAMPVITTETCGMADVVEDGFNGLLVLPADAENLALAVVRLCESAELRAGLGQEAQRTMRRYTWAHVVRKLEMVLSRAVKQRTGN